MVTEKTGKTEEKKLIVYAFLVLVILHVAGLIIHSATGVTLLEWLGKASLNSKLSTTKKVFLIVGYFALINLELAIVLWLTPRVKWMKKAGPFTWALILAILSTNCYIIPRTIYLDFVTKASSTGLTKPIVANLTKAGIKYVAITKKALSLQKILVTIGIPLSITFLLLEIDLKAIKRSIGGRPFAIFFIGSLGTVIAGFVGALIVASVFDDPTTKAEALKAIAAKIAAWIGGSENSAAVGVSALKMSGDFYSYYTLAGVIPYALYITIMFSIGGSEDFVKRINSFIKPKYNAKIIAEQYRAEVGEKKLPPKLRERDLFIVGMSALIIVMLAFAFESWFGSYRIFGLKVGSLLPTVIVATTIALIVGAYTKARDLPLLRPIGMYFLYLTIFVYIAQKTDFAKLAGAAHVVLILMAVFFIMLAIHLIVVLLGARLIKVDWATTAIASVANIGGGVTAPLCATAYGVEELVPLGVIMASIGYAIANYVGYYVGLLFLKLWAPEALAALGL
ncbi:DUF819 family protein [Pyrococcus kukulkanii]|uniref:DUF819 family protein n=1 Tax=Pyrococcus kukulkanii TaxID=1609559 RepID=UPI0035661FEF